MAKQMSMVTKYDNDDIRHYFGRRFAQLKQDRDDHVPSWKEQQEYVLPRAGCFEDVNGKQHRIPDYQTIINSTATNAVKVWTAFIMAGMSSPARPWFKLVSDEVGRDTTPEESAWMDYYRDLMLSVFARSNFYHALPRVYEEGAVFGNGCMYIDEDDIDVVRFYHYTIGEFYWAMNDRLEISTIYRPMVMKLHQLVSDFGEENISKNAMLRYKTNPDDDVHVMHVIEPNTDLLPDAVRPDNTEMKYISVYYEMNKNEKLDKVLRRNGYKEFPAMPFRLHPRSTDAYGIGISAEAMGDIRELQHKEFEYAKALDYMNEPHLKSSGSLGQIFRHPGAVTPVNPRQNDALEPVYQVNFPTGDLRAEIEALEMKIREWFDNHLASHVLNESRSNVTAREIEAAEQEKLLLAGPVLESVQIFLKKIIDRVFEVMISNQIGNPPPESMRGKNMSVEFLGLLAQAQKAIGVRTLERTWEFGAMISNVKQSTAVLDKLNADKSLENFAKMIGLPAENLNGDEDVERIRQQRQQQEQQMQQMAQAEQAANVAQKMAATPTGGKTALRDALDTVGSGF